MAALPPPSSPPVLFPHAVPPSASRLQQNEDADSTQYSLDLGALPGHGDDTENLSFGDLEEKADRLDSGDIDGPSDFTQNMEYWLRADLSALSGLRNKTATIRSERIEEVHEEHEGHEVVEIDKHTQRTSETDPQLHDQIHEHGDGQEQQERSYIEDEEDDTQSRMIAELKSQASLVHDLEEYIASDSDVGSVRSSIGTFPKHPESLPHSTPMKEPTPTPPTPQTQPRAMRNTYLQPTVEDAEETPKKLSGSAVNINASPAKSDNGGDTAKTSPATMHTLTESSDQTMRLISQLEQQKFDSDAKITTLESLLASTRADLASTREDSETRLATAMNNWKEAIKILDKRYEDLRTKDTTVQKEDIERIRAESLARITALEASLSDANLKVTDKETLLQEHLARQSEWDKEKASYLAQIKELESYTENLESRIERANVEASEEKLARQKAEHREDLEEQKREFSYKIAALESKLDEANRQLTEMSELKAKAENAEAEQEREEPSVEVSSLQSRLEHANRQLESVAKEKTDAIQGLETKHHNAMALLRMESDTKTRTLEAQVASLQTQSRSKISALESQVSMLHVQLVEAIKTPSNTSALPPETFAPPSANRDMQHFKASTSTQIESLEAQLSTSLAETASKNADLVLTKQNLLRVEQLHFRARQQVEELEATISSLRTQLGESRSELERVRQQAAKAEGCEEARWREGDKTYILEERYRDVDSEASNRLEELEDLRASSNQRIALLEQKLTEADQLATNRLAEIDRLRTSLSEQIATLDQKLADAEHLASERLDEVEALGLELEEKIEDGKEDADLHAERVSELEATIEAMKKEHDARVAELRQRAEDAVRKVGVLLEHEKREKGEGKKKIASLSREIESIRGGIQAVEAKVKGQTTEVETWKRKFETQARVLANTNQQLGSAKKEVEAARREAGRLGNEIKTVREDYEAINRAMDERIVEIVRSREEKWASRVEDLVKEREVMGKALMREWGKQEVGPGEPQGYRYKFVGGSSSSREESVA